MDFSRVKDSLEKMGYKVSCFENKDSAADYLVSQIKGTTVGIGGSMTVQEMGLYPRLCQNNQVWWHWQKNENMTSQDVISKQGEAEVYISSANGIAETGEIINIDGTCNRVADIFYGHKKVYIVAGNNKIAPDYDAALYRARNIAAPLNAQRLQKKTPCAVKGDKCYNCKSEERICRGLSVLMAMPKCFGCEYEIVLIDEPLGY